MKKTFVFIFLSIALSAMAQVESLKPYERASFYIYLDSAQTVLEEFRHARPELGNIYCTENYNKPEPSMVFTQQAGVYHYKDWAAGLRIDVRDTWSSYPMEAKGNMKDTPTRNRQFDVTPESITFRFYNDTQMLPALKEVSEDDPYKDEYVTIVGGSAAVRPQDLFAEQFECKSGSRTEDIKVMVDNKIYVCKAQVSCQHKDYRLVINFGSKRRVNGVTRHFTSGNNGGGEDYISPWKFTHILTYKLDLNTLAKAMGMNRQEMAQTIIAAGGIYLYPYPVILSRYLMDVNTAMFGMTGNQEKLLKWDANLFRPLNAMLISVLRDQTGLSQQQLDEMRPMAFQREKERVEQEKQQAHEKHLENLRERMQSAKTKWKEYYDRGLKARADSVMISEPYSFRDYNNNNVSRTSDVTKNLVSPLLLDTACIYSQMVMELALEQKDTMGYYTAMANTLMTYRQLYYSLYVDQYILKNNNNYAVQMLYSRCNDVIESMAFNRVVVSMGVADIECRAGNYYEGVKSYLAAKGHIEDETNEEEFKNVSGIPEMGDTINYKLTESLLNYLDHGGDVHDFSIPTPYMGVNALLAKSPDNLEYMDLRGRLLLRLSDKSTVKDWWNKMLAVDPDYADRETIFYNELVAAGILKVKKKKK